MTLERDRRISIRALLNAGKTPTEVSKQLGVSRTTVYAVSKSETLERKKGSVKKAKLDLEELKKIALANPLKSMRAHARDLGVSHQTVQRAIKKGGWIEPCEDGGETTFDTSNGIKPSTPLLDSIESPQEEGQNQTGNHLQGPEDLDCRPCEEQAEALETLMNQ
uniref:Transposase Synechocystis PCC 6803 domain-containing protein n=1 Tax=Lepeophtheirus salmonis TaxID=72036 RepID=A0A0K2T3W6_LEPSM